MLLQAADGPIARIRRALRGALRLHVQVPSLLDNAQSAFTRLNRLCMCVVVKLVVSDRDRPVLIALYAVGADIGHLGNGGAACRGDCQGRLGV